MAVGQRTQTDLFKLGQGSAPVASVFDDIVCLLALLLQGELTLLSHQKFVARPASRLHDTVETFVKGRVDKYEKIAELTPAGFEQQRRIENDRVDIWPRPGLLDLVSQYLSDSGMDNLFQLRPRRPLLLGRAKDQPADTAPIDLALCGEDAGAEDFSNSLLDLRFLQDPVSGGVSFDNFNSVFFTKLPGEMAFSRANATNQTDYRDSSRNIVQAGEGESGERGRGPRGLGGPERNHARLRLTLLMMHTCQPRVKPSAFHLVYRFRRRNRKVPESLQTIAPRLGAAGPLRLQLRTPPEFRDDPVANPVVRSSGRYAGSRTWSVVERTSDLTRAR